MTNEPTIEDMKAFLEDLEDTLNRALVSIFDETVDMTRKEITMGFANSVDTLMTRSVTEVDYQPLGNDAEGREFILFTGDGGDGYGLYDQENDTCVPISTDYIRESLTENDASLEEQYIAATGIVEKLDALIIS